MKYKSLVINSADKLIFGTAPYPVITPRGLILGGGHVYPEINFTITPMEVTEQVITELISYYKGIVTDILERTLRLNCEGIIIECETLIEMTRFQEIELQLVRVMNEVCENYFHVHGLKSEIRLTPNDLREFDKPPRQRTSAYLEPMMELFERRAIAGGDTACGLANTAMILAEKKYIPKIFAAIARIVTVVRTLAEIIKGENYIDAILRGCKKGLEIIENAQKEGLLKGDEKEDIWMESLKVELYNIPASEDKFIEVILPTIDKKEIILSKYGL